MTLNLFKDIAQAGYHSSLISTYSVDPAFYDGCIQHRLRSYGCENNILMADATMLKQSLLAVPEGFKGAGSRYAVVPISTRGCFHPKIHLRLGTDRAALVIGSANATAAGWGSNQEVGTVFSWRKGTEMVTSAPFIRRAYDYLDTWLSNAQVESIEFKRDLHFKYSPWLRDIEPNVEPVRLPDGSLIDVFFESGTGGQAMLAKLRHLVGDEIPQRLTIVSPYWDRGLQSLNELHQLLQMCPLFIALHPDKSEFPVDALKNLDATFVSLKAQDNEHRFLHAKIILVETSEFDHVIFGSANCSDDALGGLKLPARNAEVSVYRRAPAGKIRETLGIDLSRTLNIHEIKRTRIDSENQVRASSLAAGYVEYQDKVLIWTPPEGLVGRGAKIMLGGAVVLFNALYGSKFKAELSETPKFPLIAHILLGDGRKTDPIIVHDKGALRRASPGAMDGRLQRAFSRIESGEEDLIDLAREAHIIFAPDNVINNTNASTRSKGDSPTASAEQHFATSDEFRAALVAKPATGETQRFSTSDPGLIELLRIILKGVVDIDGRDAEKKKEEEENAALMDGEDEDGAEDRDSSIKTPLVVKSEVEERIYTTSQIDLRRKYLLKALDTFDTLVNVKEAQVSSRLLTQTAFALNLMLYACKKEHKMKSGCAVTLMDFSSEDIKKRELTFALRAGRLLQNLWVGIGKAPEPLVRKINIDMRFGLPDDVFLLIVISRWAVARAFISTSEKRGLKGLQESLGVVAVKLYRATDALGPIDWPKAESIISELDKRIGFSETETKALVSHCRSFAKESTMP